ncbi:MmcB family DNA repair protein [Loigolactobacillus coryniformis subsp. coryniformis]|uniref:MmcB family DNA repair protein n=1 Tax=Loigolactobacillus coryniformis TaxID=1610 RepID=UPI003991B63D
MNNKLAEISTELATIFAKDKKSWAEVYELLSQVQNEQLYLQDARFKSFTAFVKGFAADNHIAESSIWRKFKAGRVYAHYTTQQAAKGVTNIVAAQDFTVSEDNLVTVGKLAKGDYAATKDLLDKVKSGVLTRHDLREAYRVSKPVATKKSTLDASNQEENPITEASITLLLASNYEWLNELGVKSIAGKSKAFGRSGIERKYKTLAQFPVVVPSSHYARRVDVIAVENQTTDYRELAIHGFEIKISPSDLHNDRKYTEYNDFVDLFWVVIADTPAMLAQAKVDVPEPFGVIAADINMQRLSIIRKADSNRGRWREATLMTALIKTM